MICLLFLATEFRWAVPDDIFLIRSFPHSAPRPPLNTISPPLSSPYPTISHGTCQRTSRRAHSNKGYF
jgi:hypothetical protein